MNHSEEIRKIAEDIVKTEAGGLENSQYWGLRLRIVADILESKNLSPFRPHTKEEFEAYGRFIDSYFAGSEED